MSWAMMNFVLFKIIYQFTDSIGKGTGWGEAEFFVFLGTIWIINSLIQTFVMVNASEFSEMIRTGSLDFALLKPIDTQFLISFPRVNWSQLANAVLGVFLVIYYVHQLSMDPNKHLYLTPITIVAYAFFILCGSVVMYSVMIVLSSTSIWLGRNQNLVRFLVLHYELLSLPHGDLPTERNRLGVVGHVYVCRTDSGCVQRAGTCSGPAAWHTLEDVGVVAGRVCNCCGGGKFAGQPLGIQNGASQLPKRQQLMNFG